MSDLNFDRAEYLQPQPPHILEGVERDEGNVVGRPLEATEGPFVNALLLGAGAAIVGAAGYALVSLSGFMVSIVAIGMAWLIAKAMMTASNGIGGRRYQVAAIVLTYFSVSLGELLPALQHARADGMTLGYLLGTAQVWTLLLAGPLLRLQRGFNGIIGIVILLIGMRTAWRMAAGGPGFTRRGSIA